MTAMLNVVETNPFKHLTHLSLKFVPGSDTDVKKYLADCLKQFKVCSSFKTELILWIVVFLLTLCPPVSSADNLGKQFGPRSGPRICRA